jgi:hypothetical protein
MIVRCGLMLTAVAATAPAAAQDFSMPPINPGIIASVARTDVLGSHLREVEQGGNDAAVTTALIAASAATLRYAPSAQRRRINMARFVEKTRSSNPSSAAKMEQLFASVDVIAAMDRALAPVGLRTDNVADAYAVWWMTAWGAAHGDTSTPSMAKAQAVRAQAARAVAAVLDSAKADAAAKQEYAEALLVQAALIDGMVEQYGQDPAMAPKIASSVRKGARASGLDLDAMTLTEEGFVPAKRTGAVARPSGGGSQAFPATGNTGVSPRYGLLAAVGGAGLGAAFLVGKAVGRKG